MTVVAGAVMVIGFGLICGSIGYGFGLSHRSRVYLPRASMIGRDDG
jgi:hypothetical protein